ncbi:MAG: metallophosphoesterase family protein [Candidatus Kappaea frigidicola]|nr:metallophosphoesterase family protein [Candidatus Kappaea frigidicola]
MLKIGVISDTHIPINSLHISDEIKSHFQKCDLILHAGDLIEINVMSELKKIAPVVAVAGNMDNVDVKNKLPKKQVIKIDKYHIGLMHDPGNLRKKEEILKNNFATDKLDILIYGHTHIPMCETYKKTVFFNPGSATDTIFAPYKSVGLIYLNSTIKTNIIKLEE